MKSKLHVLLGAMLLGHASSLTAMTLAAGGKPRCVIVQQAGATAPEQHAVAELALHLDRITGAKFEVQTNAVAVSQRAIIVGEGPVAAALFPEIDFARLGAEELVIRTRGNRLLLAGGRPRGTIYAVNRFLQEQCGVRWWTPWATNLPRRATLRVPVLNVREQPAFEYREPFWFAGFDPLWKARNGANGENRRIPADWGGCVTYKGFCHTFYPLVPPEKYFAAHPEWYSEINGKRTHDHAQLCLSNPELRDFVVSRVKEWLREAPDANIISVTQNDWHGQCQCAQCKAIDDAEGSPSGSMITFVNYVAEKIQPEFPNVAVDTFAYQYTRKPPKHVKPRPNVIVRLCSIECNFREPLDGPSNARFLADLAGWSKICQRLYIWDYTTDFRNYVLPHPNWFTLGPNVRLFQKYGVRGVFEQGAYQGYGGEMGELRVWLLAQLLWNPQQDDRALIREFLEGYYGRAAARPIGRYLDLMYDASKGFYLGCYTRPFPPHLEFPVLYQAERLWQQAEKAVAHEPERLARVRLSHLPVRYAFLRDWQRLRYDCWEQNATWPLPESLQVAAAEFAATCRGVPGSDWTQVKRLREHHYLVEDFVGSLTNEPPLLPPSPPKRLSRAAFPADLKGKNLRGAVDLQDNVARLAKPGEWAEIRPDAAASDRRAAWMPGNHREWAFRIPADQIPKSPTGAWTAYVVARVEPANGGRGHSAAFGAGVYDNAANQYPADAKFPLRDVSENYRSYAVGTFEPGPARDIFVAPAGNPAVRAVWVDRVILIPQR
jgi:hypothetical protein